jgi:hypothetical protein
MTYKLDSISDEEAKRQVDGPEPYTRIYKVRRFMADFHLGGYSPNQLYSALESAGLQIIEKGKS